MPSSSGGPGRSRRSPLPRRSTLDVDREDDRSTVAELLRRPSLRDRPWRRRDRQDHRGPGRGQRVEGHFPGQVCFLDLGLLGIKESGPRRAGIGLGPGRPQPRPDRAIVAHLRERNMLLLLDCCEHVIDSVGSLGRGDRAGGAACQHPGDQPRTPAGRGRTRLCASRPWTSPPDDIILGAGDVHRYAAASLFIDRAFAGGLRRPLNDLDAQVIGDICRKVDGIALALELAAGRVSVHGLEGNILAARWPAQTSVAGTAHGGGAPQDIERDAGLEPRPDLRGGSGSAAPPVGPCGTVHP